MTEAIFPECDQCDGPRRLTCQQMFANIAGLQIEKVDAMRRTPDPVEEQMVKMAQIADSFTLALFGVLEMLDCKLPIEGVRTRLLLTVNQRLTNSVDNRGDNL